MTYFTCDEIAAGIVLYNPDMPRLTENVHAILPQIKILYLFDNGSANISEVKQTFTDKRIIIIESRENIGIAAALNAIIYRAKEDKLKWVLTLDQDSISPENLISEYSKNIATERIGMLCCRIIDRNFGEISIQKIHTHGIEEVSMCITSASMINIKAWNDVGKFTEKLFIDAVDFDMCLLLREHGWKILRTNDVALLHEVGHSEIRKLFGKEYLVYHHSPLRYYYMVRNGIYLGKRHHFICHAIIRAFRQITMVILYEDRKVEKLKMMIKGFYHAIIGRYGKLIL